MSERPIGTDPTGSVEPGIAASASPVTRRIVGRQPDRSEWTEVASRLLITSVWTVGFAIVVTSGLLLWGLLFEPTGTADPFLGQPVTLGSAEETPTLELSEGRSIGAPTTTAPPASPGIIVADSTGSDRFLGPTDSPVPVTPAEKAPASPVGRTPAAEPLAPKVVPAQQPPAKQPQATTPTTRPPTTQPSYREDSSSSTTNSSTTSSSSNSGSGSSNSGSGSDNSGSGSSNSGSGSSNSGSGNSGSGSGKSGSDDPDDRDPDDDPDDD